MDADNLSEEFANSVLPVTIFIGVLGIFGGLGNIFVLYVYRYKYPPCNFRTFVTCLGVTDFVSCLFVFPCEIAGHRIWFSYPTSAEWFCKLKTGVFAVAVMTTSIILLLISIDRFRKVCRPFGSQINVQNAFRLCVASVILSVTITLPIPILFGIQHENITFQGRTFEITSCENDDAYKDTLLMPLYLILLYYSPIAAFMVTTTFLYSLILRKIVSKSFPSDANVACEEHRSQTQKGIIHDLQNETELQREVKNDTEVRGEQNNFVSNKRQSDESSCNQGTDKGRILDKQADQTKTPESGSFELHEQAESKHEMEANYKVRRNTVTKNCQARKGRVSISKHRITRKTIIMFVVTLVFNVTMLIYFCALFVIVRRKHIFEVVDTETAAIFFLCWRIYFINHVINPVVYGLLDYRFREAFSHDKSSRNWYQ